MLILSDADKLFLKQIGVAAPEDFPSCVNCGKATDMSHVLNHCQSCGSGRIVSVSEGETGEMICLQCGLAFNLKDIL